MAKIDNYKEWLNTLRVIFTVVVLVIIALTSGLITRLDNNKIDYFLYVGVALDIILMISIPFVFRLMAKITKEIKYIK